MTIYSIIAAALQQRRCSAKQNSVTILKTLGQPARFKLFSFLVFPFMLYTNED